MQSDSQKGTQHMHDTTLVCWVVAYVSTLKGSFLQRMAEVMKGKAVEWETLQSRMRAPTSILKESERQVNGAEIIHLSFTPTF